MGRNNKDFIGAIEAKDPFDRTHEENTALRESKMFKAQDDYYKPDYRDTSKDK